MDKKILKKVPLKDVDLSEKGIYLANGALIDIKTS